MTSNIHKYIVIPEKYIGYKRCWLLIDKICYVFSVMLENEHGLPKYPIEGFTRPMSILEVYMQYKKRILKNEDLYSETQRGFVISLYSFLSSIPEEKVISHKYYDEYVPRFNVFNSIKAIRIPHLPRSIYARLDMWLVEKNEIMERVEDIVKSYNYNYAEMKVRGREFYMELTKYAYNPERIERFADIYNMDFGEYLERIDL